MESVSNRAAQLLPQPHALAAPLRLGGASVAAFGLLSDVLREGSVGMGVVQALLVVAGCLAIAVGGVLASPEPPVRLRSRFVESVDARRGELLRFGVIVVQVGLLVLVLRAYRIESPAFYEQIVPIAFWGFLLHHALPHAQRLAFFVLLSFTGIWAVFGWVGGAWLVGLGLLLITICYLPLAFAARVALLLLTGGGLVLLRAGHWEAGFLPGAIWPILGSMFMFRLICYLYDLRHATSRPGLTQTLAYFFLLPNVVFPLFPVVDFATFRRTYYDQDPFRIYQQGVRWILRGTIHLLLYRLVYQHLVLSPAEVSSPAELGQYLLANFLLYLRVSGQFHLIVGLLHLFGFRLPETHRFFYLASSFTDFWRRINIYWKDFMQKVFFNPAYFRLRRRGETFALVGATLFVFFATWFFHSFQWFWILGEWLLSWTDVLFWSILALLLVANSLLERRYGRVRTLGRPSWTARTFAGRALKTGATFSVICILWSLWTSPTLADWLALWDVVELPTRETMLLTTALALGVAVCLGLASYGARRIGSLWSAPERALQSAFALPVLVPVVLLYATPATSGAPLLSGRLGALVSELRAGELNRADAARLSQGYYEQLTGVNRFNSQLWEVYATKPAEWPKLTETEAVRFPGGFVEYELRPSTTISFRGARLGINRWGMRDRDYELAAPPATRRIALLGSSYVMGIGVGDEETFENLLERQLNEEAADRAGVRYELLNFAVSGHAASQQLVILKENVSAFHPDVILFFSHPAADPRFIIAHLSRALGAGVDLPYADLVHIAERAGVESGISVQEIARRLGPFQAELLSAVYRQIFEESRRQGAVPVWISLILPGDKAPQAELELPARLAAEAGLTVVDLTHVYQGQAIEALQVAPWDHHPNARGHQLIADALYRALREKTDVLASPSHSESAHQPMVHSESSGPATAPREGSE